MYSDCSHCCPVLPPSTCQDALFWFWRQAFTVPRLALIPSVHLYVSLRVLGLQVVATMTKRSGAFKQKKFLNGSHIFITCLHRSFPAGLYFPALQTRKLTFGILCSHNSSRFETSSN